VSQTQKFLDEANLQLADAQRRATDKRLEADTLEFAAERDSRTKREEAAEAAAAMIREAEDRAVAIVAEAEQRSRTLIEDAEERLEAIRHERDEVASYFEGLRGVLQHAEQVSADS